MDKLNGYEDHAATFVRCRSEGIDGVGATSVRHWVRSLPTNATVPDIGCGIGDPISKALGLNVYGIDASPSMVKSSGRTSQIFPSPVKRQKIPHFSIGSSMPSLPGDWCSFCRKRHRK